MRTPYLLFLTVILSLPPIAFAFERDHDAHVHGHAALMIVQEKNELQVQLTSPAMNIVGFEHQPKNHEQEETVHAAEEQLKNATQLITFNANVGCELEHVHVQSALLAAAEEHHDEHKEHDHYDQHHDDHKDHDHHDHDEASGHSEFEVDYHFECASIDALSEIEVGLFKAFPSLEEIDANIVTDKVQKQLELNASDNVIKL